ncbi:MAG: twin-arginine translocase subunit TatC [Endomicrobium sp.]|nr:twin-arginine translocase subunit TatC [Endomicrobium sp.]
MSIAGHLEELRWLLIRCAAYIAAASVIALFFTDEILYILKLPSQGLIEDFMILKPAEAVTIYIKTAFFAGLTAAFFPVLWEFFNFVKPAIDQSRGSSVLKRVLTSFLLFACGIAFVYFAVLTPAISFLMRLSQGLTQSHVQLTLSSYVSFTCALLFCGGMIFQIPLLAFMLTKIGAVTPSFLSSKRREAYFSMCVFAAIITPTTDVFSLSLFMVPMAVLYETGIVFSKMVYKNKLLPGGEVYEQT